MPIRGHFITHSNSNCSDYYASFIMEERGVGYYELKTRIPGIIAE